MVRNKTAITIGMPIYNGERRLRLVLDPWLSQTFSDFVLFISDNNSTDQTQEICEEYAKQDDRIEYYRQKSSIRGGDNFKFVLLNSPVSEFFTWAADDDIRSKNWLESNYNFLQANPECVASTSPNTYEKRDENVYETWEDNVWRVDFALEGDEFHRYEEFFKNGYEAHALFHSLIRRKVLIECCSENRLFEDLPWLGFDWLTVLSIASKGKIHRTENGCMNVGTFGPSQKPTVLYQHTTSWIEYIIPFFVMLKRFINMEKKITKFQLLKLMPLFIKINTRAYTSLYRWYCQLVINKFKQTMKM